MTCLLAYLVFRHRTHIRQQQLLYQYTGSSSSCVLSKVSFEADTGCLTAL
jgi:hypothetical protein